jgi:hypothetical protein
MLTPVGLVAADLIIVTTRNNSIINLKKLMKRLKELRIRQR